MSSWWQNKLLRYGLRYGLQWSGLLEDEAIDLDTLDFTIGRQNIITLKNVGLNIKKISKLAQLPPSLRLETARVLSLKITIPADFYQSSIVVEADGVEISASMQKEEAAPRAQPKTRARSPVSVKTPQHRTMHRRLRSPPPYDPGRLPESEEELRIPTAQEVAKSFLMDEPLQERRDIEALAATQRGIEESFASESSEGDNVGTGLGVGVPGFLTNFVRGMVDRFKLEVKNVEVKVETHVQEGGRDDVPIALRLRLGGVQLSEIASDRVAQPKEAVQKRNFYLSDIVVDLLSDGQVVADLSSLPSYASPLRGKSPARSSRPSELSNAANGAFSPHQQLTAHMDNSFTSASGESIGLGMEPTLGRYQDSDRQALPQTSPSLPPFAMAYSTATVDEERFADARSDTQDGSHGRTSDLDIQPGDDNVSWGSRRSQTSGPEEDLWKSMESEGDLPDSLILEHERAPTPRALSSRATSPSAVRQRTSLPPNDRRGLHSSDSWPRMDNSEMHRLQSPGSWPTLDVSTHTSMDPLDRVLAAADKNEVLDNKQNALEQVDSNEAAIPETPPEFEDAIDESMLQSRMFSHEDAQSMYMSAMTSSPKMDVPGAWESPEQHGRSPAAETAQSSVLEDSVVEDVAEQLDGRAQSIDRRSGNATPRPLSSSLPSTPPTASGHAVSMTAKELIRIDRISIDLPTSSEQPFLQPESESQDVYPPGLSKSANPAHGMPGTFSTYANLSASQRKGTSSVHTDATSVFWTPQGTSVTDAPSIDLDIGSIIVQIDIPTGRLLYAASNRLMASATGDEPYQAGTTASESALSPLSFNLEHFQLSFAECMGDRIAIHGNEAVQSRGAIDIVCGAVYLHLASDMTLRVGDFGILLGGQDLLVFDDNADSITTSQVLPPRSSAITVSVNRDRISATNRPVMDVNVQTSALNLMVDLGVIDGTFSSFGGLSGMLEVGSSILSDSGTSSPVTSRPAKGVRFEGDVPSLRKDPELKLNAIVDGFLATLSGSACSVQLRTSKLKTVYREGGTVAAVDHVVVSGPFCGEQTPDAPLMIDLAKLRIDFLLAPHDKDLERLLSLLTPSKDPYDDDGDILIDTLIRQRRKGSVLRAVVNDIKLKITHWDCIPSLVTLSEDLVKLSAVTKYLPEDERPGLLTLLRIKEGDARFPVNDRFGTMRFAIVDLHLAHVGLPALVAFSISSILARQSGGSEILHPLLPLYGTENLPIIMGRMLGGEVEPTFKIKLFNLCVEYSVPVILAFTDKDKELDTEELVNELAQSVAALAMDNIPQKLKRSPASDLSNVPQKKMKISLLIHDSGVGLTPQMLHSKVIIVLSDAHLSTIVPTTEGMSAEFSLRKASILVTNHILDAPLLPSTSSGKLSTSTQRVESALATQGFVSVGSLRAVEVRFHARDSDELDGAKAVVIEIRNQLFLMETCADSTQTLIATLSALAPPVPTNKEPKYLTQPMGIEDMMASFTGDPFVKPDSPLETLFDVERDVDDEGPEVLLGVSTFDEETNDLLAESEMTSSLYGPVGSVFGMDNDIEGESDMGDYQETAESLLEEDPFEMPTSPTDMPLGDNALLRDLNRQCRRASDGVPVDLGLYEIEDLGFDALGSGQQALGAQLRFNAPYAGKRGSLPSKRQKDIPFRLRLREFNLQWHLYDGYDWQRTRDGITEAVEQVEARCEERDARRRRSAQEREDDETVIGDFLFNSIYIGVSNDQDAQDIRRQINRTIDDQVSETESIPVSATSRPTQYSASGQPRQRARKRLKLGRSRSPKITFDLRKVAADVLLMPPGSGEVVSSVDLRLKDFEIFDKVPTSTWRKFLTHLDSEREMSKPMFHIQLDNVKTLESHAASEIVLHVSVLPLRLHVDQDALDFITRFFEFKDADVVGPAEPSEQPFLQRVEVDTVDLCLDYKPKKIDYAGLRSGKTTEFMNIITLEGCNIRLKHAIIYGLRGFDALHPTLNDIWMPDVKKNQLPQVLAGLAPVRSLVTLGAGIRDVVAIPISEYKKDGRIVRSIQKGAFQFGKTTTAELARLGAKIALGTQTALATTEDFLSPSAAAARHGTHPLRHELRSTDFDEDEAERQAPSPYANQPIGVLSGLKSARRHLEIDLLTARDAFIAVQGEFLDSRGPGDVVGAVAKHAPTVILRPLIGTARAAGTALLGVGNQIDRDGLRRVNDKYKPR